MQIFTFLHSVEISSTVGHCACKEKKNHVNEQQTKVCLPNKAATGHMHYKTLLDFSQACYLHPQLISC